MGCLFHNFVFIGKGPKGEDVSKCSKCQELKYGRVPYSDDSSDLNQSKNDDDDKNKKTKNIFGF